MGSIRALPLEDAFGILQQCGVEEPKTEVVPKGTDNRNISAILSIAGMRPFQYFVEP